MCDLPELMTVEEAARYLRIGRTKAYAMTRQWRTSGGRLGLPAVEIGNALRVSRPRLEELIAAALVAEEAPPGSLDVAPDLHRPAECSTPGPATPAASPRRARGPPHVAATAIPGPDSRPCSSRRTRARSASEPRTHPACRRRRCGPAPHDRRTTGSRPISSPRQAHHQPQTTNTSSPPRPRPTHHHRDHHHQHHHPHHHEPPPKPIRTLAPCGAVPRSGRHGGR